jgi:hypothetical protein
MSMAALPLPRRHRYGGSGAAAANFSRLSSRCGAAAVDNFLDNNSKKLKNKC